MREGVATGGGGRGRMLGYQVEWAAPGKVKLGILYNGLIRVPVEVNGVPKLRLKNLEED